MQLMLLMVDLNMVFAGVSIATVFVGLIVWSVRQEGRITMVQKEHTDLRKDFHEVKQDHNQTKQHVAKHYTSIEVISEQMKGVKTSLDEVNKKLDKLVGNG